MRCFNPSNVKKLNLYPKKSTTSPLPVDGNRFKFTENIIIIIKPTQKVGKLKKNIEIDQINLLIKLFGFNPAITPKGIPMTIDNSKANNVNSRVAGSLSRINVIAGLL
mgnify:CR=1 FL=1